MDSAIIASNYRLDKAVFDEWLVSSGYSFRRRTFGGLDVDDTKQDIKAIVAQFREERASFEQAQQQAAAEKVRLQAEERLAVQRAAEEKQRALSGMLITSGFNFDGYTITRYSGYISGDDPIQIPRGQGGLFNNVTDVGESLMKSLVQIRRNALAELKEAAYALGCNAVIGVDFDYLTLDPETATGGGGTLYLPYVFGVTANGNAVVIERKDS
jgi:uncharacterized protein YbjQ (UPF0145 family)